MRIGIKLGIALLWVGWAAPAALAGCHAHLAVVVSDHVKVRATAAHAEELLCAVAAQLGLDPDHAKMVLAQIGPDETSIADVSLGKPIREIHSVEGPGGLYLVWLVGDADDIQIAGLLGSALADAAQVRLPSEDFMAAVRRAVLLTRATVNKNALLKPSH